MLKIQTLIVTTGQKDHSLLERMNIQTEAIVGNQCDRTEYEEFLFKDKPVRWFSMTDKGVGLNRNTVFMHSDADICILCDDDMVFHDGYAQEVEKWFEKYPQADMLLFNLDEVVLMREKNTKVVRVNQGTYGKYGAARIAFRRKSVLMSGVFFHMMFGGGAPFSCGEDTIFLHDCLARGLHILGIPVAIAKLDNERQSTWFTGFHDKFFFDKGVLFGLLYGRKGKFLTFYHCLKHRNGMYRSYGWKNAFRTMCRGIDEISTLGKRSSDQA